MRHKSVLSLPQYENIVTFHFKAPMNAFHHHGLETGQGVVDWLVGMERSSGSTLIHAGIGAIF